MKFLSFKIGFYLFLKLKLRPGTSGSDDDPDTTDPGTGRTTTDTPTDRRPTGGTPTDGTPPVDPVADVDCPDKSEADRRVCWPHDDGALLRSASSVVFEPTADLDEVATLTFTLRNTTGESFGLNPYAWRIDRWTGESWRRVAPDVYIEPWTHVPDGGTYEWVLSREQHSTPGGESAQAVVQDLDPGTYAFTVSGILGGDDEAAGERVALSALFVVRD